MKREHARRQPTGDGCGRERSAVEQELLGLARRHSIASSSDFKVCDENVVK